jgi:hypothetical protein
MSKLVLVVTRKSSRNRFGRVHIEHVNRRLSPDNIDPATPCCIERDGVLMGIIGGTELVRIRGTSACLGHMTDEWGDWWAPSAPVPDGTFALFRADGKYVELLSDVLASRTIWYAQTDDLFIASTSQRAILFFLGDYRPNVAVYPWMLSAGNLGPKNGWDVRLRSLPGDARLRLDRDAWQVTLRRTPVSYQPIEASDTAHERRLRAALEESFASTRFDHRRWLLPLSGGYDSRGVLMLLPSRQNLRTVTWGLRSALTRRGSDASVARTLAQTLGLDHTYYPTDVVSEPVAATFERFVRVGEGRVDHVSGYMDGFRIWKNLFESGQHGIIRGDEAFGCIRVATPLDAYRNMSLTTLSHYANAQPLLESLGSPRQEVPDEFTQREDETLATWRDRLNSQFEMPVVLAALNDLKLSYVEITNPLLTRRIVTTVRTLPDHLRTDKLLFKRIVDGKSPDVPYARTRATAFSRDILRSRDAVHAIHDVLASDHAASTLPQELIDYLTQRRPRTRGFGTGGRMSMKLHAIANRVFGYVDAHARKPAFDPYIIAFRAYLIVKMDMLLRADAAARSVADTDAQEL